MLEFLRLLINDYTFKIVALGTMLLGLSSGVLSSFVTLNKQSLIGDALSHAALPGIVLAFMIFKTKDLKVLLLGALVFSLMAIFIINIIRKYSRVKFDSALALILSAFFGLGLILLSVIQKTPAAGQAGLNNFIFGQPTTMLKSDIYIMLVVAVLVIFLVLLFWKELKLFIFSSEYAHVLGFKTGLINILFSALIIASIIVGLEAVGIILIAALLVAPGIAARQWTNKLSVMVFLSGLFGSLSGLFGSLIGLLYPNIATGAVIVVILSMIALVSILFGTKRGIIKKRIKRRRIKPNLEEKDILT